MSRIMASSTMVPETSGSSSYSLASRRRRPYNGAVAAVANKPARIAWALLLERTSGRLGASCRRNRSVVVCARRTGHGTGVHGGAARPGATGVRARRAEPGAGRGAVRGRGEHPLPVAADLADRGPTGGEAARRRARATPGRGSARPAEGAGGRGQRPHPGRVRGLAPRARRGGGERPDRVPGAQEARPHAQKSQNGK